jgi:hypothetical protein
MMRLEWDAVGERFYESGLDRGVLYLDGKGQVWNGLISIEENDSGAINVPVYIDNLKVRDVPRIGDYTAQLGAYTYPDDFLACEGVIEVDNVFVDGQIPKTFGLSYRTRVGNDVEGAELGYRIHLVYNLTAIPDTKSYTTLSLSPEPTQFGWGISAVPQKAFGYRPTAHIIFDTRFLTDEMLQSLEDIIYGTESLDPTLPPIDYFLGWTNKWGLLTIIDHGNGIWSAIDDGDFISIIDETTFQIDAPTVVTLDPVTYQVSSILG